MTRGGPGTSTDLISYFIYRSAFYGLDLGKASAISSCCCWLSWR
jgi:multiple sugar transport system permease protein